MVIRIKVIPNSGVVRIEKKKDKNLDYIIKLNSSPEKGKANSELIKILSDYFEIKKTKIAILKGLKSRLKLVEIG
jgi:uncharacterized protein (TIGR00251 family)